MIDPNQIFPHKTSGDLALRIESLDVTLPSGTRTSAKARPPVAVAAHVYDLHADEEIASWLTAHVGIRAVLAESVLRALVPVGSDPIPETVMLVAVTCPTTKLRRRVFLTADSDRPGEWYGEVDLRREDVRGVVDFAPLLARTTDLPVQIRDGDGASLATYRGGIIAHGGTAQVRIDSASERRGSLNVRWENFSASEHSWRKAHAHEMFYIDVSEDRPELVLNSAHESLKQTLMKKRPRGAEGTIKSALLAYIAHSAWMSLFIASLSACAPEDDEGEVSWPSDDLRRKVLNRILPLAIPEHSDSTERLRLAVELLRDPARLSTLLTQLNSAIQSLLRVDDLVLKSLELGLEEAA